ncbi:MAG: hypothetical protein EOM85_02960 [Candidatus Moranbacteria bacterium]|nr:hypothetical protein [Candidatus Moranbacteria bacterium]
MQSKQKQKLYIIPGWGETPRFKNSRELIDIVSEKYKVVPIRYVSKKEALLSENLKIVRDQLKSPTNKSIILGFSMGALFAYILASEIKFEKVIVCSISPILENDLDFYAPEDVHKLFTDREIKEFKRWKYKKIKCPAIFMCGDKEGEEETFRTKELHKKNGGKIVIIKGQTHKLNKKYLREIKKFL